MKQRLFILVFIVGLGLLLAALNAASYVQKDKAPDTESSPQRSTYNPGGTGTQALYSLLAETKRSVMRWRESPATLLSARVRPSVFVIVGPLKKRYTEADAAALWKWVAEGGRLVIIDREPQAMLVGTTANWDLSTAYEENYTIYGADPLDRSAMTAGVTALRPLQPTYVSERVNSVQFSKFAGFVRFQPKGTAMFSSKAADEYDDEGNEVAAASFDAPVAHLTTNGKDVLVEAAYGEGRVLLLTDPYIVSNAGISLADNAQLAINIVGSQSGTTAFDEFHQGFEDGSQFLKFFEGTPVAAIFFQCALIAGLVLFSQSRRFARAVPEPEPDRLTKLEYVAAMAELQARTRAYDLAIENVYTDFRRRAARQAGLDILSVKASELARAVASRSSLAAENIEAEFVRCEEIIRGEPADKKDAIRLVSFIRALESETGLSRSGAKDGRR